MTTTTDSSSAHVAVRSIAGAGLATLALAVACTFSGCDEREPSTTFKKHVTTETDDSGYSIATGVGGRPDTGRGLGDPLRFAYYGLPLSDPLQPQLTPLFNLGYVVGYDHGRRCPAWAAYRLFATDTKAKDTRSDKAGSSEDARIAQAPSADDAASKTKAAPKPDDYDRKSGVTRRHLVPSGAIASDYGDDAGAETRLSSDIAPAPAEADNAWDTLVNLEPAYAQAYNELWVMTGPLFEGDKRLPSGTAAPSAFWKIQVTVQDGRTRTQAFIVPAQPVTQKKGVPVDLATRMVSVADIEAKTGLTFFGDFHDSDGDTVELLKSVVADGLWPTDASQPQPVASAQKPASAAKKPSAGSSGSSSKSAH